MEEIAQIQQLQVVLLALVAIKVTSTLFFFLLLFS